VSLCRLGSARDGAPVPELRVDRAKEVFDQLVIEEAQEIEEPRRIRASLRHVVEVARQERVVAEQPEVHGDDRRAHGPTRETERLHDRGGAAVQSAFEQDLVARVADLREDLEQRAEVEALRLADQPRLDLARRVALVGNGVPEHQPSTNPTRSTREYWARARHTGDSRACASSARIAACRLSSAA